MIIFCQFSIVIMFNFSMFFLDEYIIAIVMLIVL